MDKINLKRSDKYVALSNLNIYYTSKNIKTPYKNNKFKILALTWSEVFELCDGLYSVNTILGILSKQNKTVTGNPRIKTENSITFRKKERTLSQVFNA